MDTTILEAIKQLPPKQQPTAVAIQHHLNKWADSEKQVSKKVRQLQTEYLRSVIPLQNEINAIIKGLRAPTEEEIKDANTYQIEIKDIQASPLQNYWGQVLMNNSLTGKLISESDKSIFRHLLSVNVELGENGKDFTLKFEFEDNENFDACILTKAYVFEDSDDEFPSKQKGSQIKWKEGKNITKKIVKRKQKNKKTGQTREIEKEEKAPTFFHFFEDVDQINNEDEKIEREQFDFELGSQFVNQIIPKALFTYLGLKVDDEEEDDFEGDDDESEGEEESLEDD
ncbi:unnamed protein product [Paramecium primaurelia]|uniref:Nucleosome assembly protein n=2 Tax=Paramecium TaxID=5884 RepID=A0A8S1UM55_9CILI|nr:unnamed protein product [Paramecium primaurelia]CAD8164829.1 unnamed protein product [Paramecium pentaurelia]